MLIARLPQVTMPFRWLGPSIMHARVPQLLLMCIAESEGAHQPGCLWPWLVGECSPSGTERVDITQCGLRRSAGHTINSEEEQPQAGLLGNRLRRRLQGHLLHACKGTETLAQSISSNIVMGR